MYKNRLFKFSCVIICTKVAYLYLISKCFLRKYYFIHSLFLIKNASRATRAALSSLISSYYALVLKGHAHALLLL